MIVNFSVDLLNFSFSIKGEGFVVIAAFIFSVGAIYAKKLTKSMDVMVVTGYSLFIGGIYTYYNWYYISVVEYTISQWHPQFS